MKASLFVQLVSTLVASVKATEIEFSVGSCEELTKVDAAGGTASALTIIIYDEVYCHSDTRFPVETKVTLKSDHDLIFTNVAFDVRGSGELILEPVVYFNSGGEVKDVDGGALSVSKEAKVTFQKSVGFDYISVTKDGPNAKRGGAVFNEGELTIKGYAYFIGNNAGRGGAVFNSGTFISSRAFYYENTAASGGGIYNSGSVVATGGDVWRNHAETSGGAIVNTGRIEFADDITFDNNAAREGDGGAIHNTGAVVFSGEEAASFKWNFCAGVGGAVANKGGVLRLGTRTAFEGNTSGASGSAVYNDKQSKTEFPQGGDVSFRNYGNVEDPGGPIYYDNFRDPDDIIEYASA